MSRDPALSHQGNSFTYVRLVAAAMVLFAHHYALWGLHEPGLLGRSFGPLGVNIFFGISGYLVALNLERDGSPWRFAARRLLRIMPGLTVNVIFCAVVVGAWLSTLPLADYFAHPDFRGYFWNLLFRPMFALPAVLADARVPYAINGSLWTLPFEMFAYLVLAVLLLVGARSLRWTVPTLLVFSLIAAALWRPAEQVVFWANDLRFVPLFTASFLVGTTLALWRDRIPRQSLLLWLLVLYAVSEGELARLLVGTVLVSVAAVHVGSQPLRIERTLANDCSYGLYLYAFPVQQALIAKAGTWGFWPTMALAFVITGILATLSWWLVEKPALRWKPSRGVSAVSPPVMPAG